MKKIKSVKEPEINPTLKNPNTNVTPVDTKPVSFPLTTNEVEAFRLLLVQMEAANFSMSRYLSHVTDLRGLDPKQWVPSKDLKFLVRVEEKPSPENTQFKVV